MGVYLSSPITEKVSADKAFGKFSYGVSSMQGWRMTQEDSHNCIPDFDPDTQTSYFAVYDGHGGAEVAQYCSAKLPDFLKSTLGYKDGQLGDALQEAFLGFDATLRDEAVIKELKSMAGVDDDGEEDEDDGDPVGRTEADLLRAEADIPIEELVAKYGEGMTSIPARKFKKDEKFLSPMIRPKRATEGAKTSNEDNDTNVNNSNNCDKNNSASASCSGLADSIVTRLEDKLANGHADNENNLNTEKELREAESVNSDKTEDMETDKDVTQKSIKGDVDNCVPDSSELSNSVQNVNSNKSEDKNLSSIDSSEADSTSVNDLKDTSGANDKTREEKISEEVDESKPSSSSDGPYESGSQKLQPESSGSGETSGSSGPSGSKDDSSEPSGSGVAVSREAEASGSAGSSGEGPSGSGAGASGSGAGSSGVGSSGSGSGGKTVLDEEYDSEDDSSEDNEYMEDSEEEEEEEDEEDDEELDEEEKQHIGGIFSKVIAAHDEDDGHIEEPGSDSGCTAVVAVLRKNELVVANAGDSRCVLCRNGEAIDLSVDHKPEDDDERKRIEAAGGKVTADGRVNGGLNLSRALGDHWYKRNDSILPQEQMISPWPDVQSEVIGEQDEFMVIACDGIWNYMTSQEVVDFVKERLQEEEKRKQLSLICEEMFDHCLAPNTMGDGTGCDNMTCIIVLFHYKSRSSTPVNFDCSEADSSTVDESQPDKEAKSSATQNQQENSGADKRPRENCSADSQTDAESQPEKRARLEEDSTTS